MSESPKPPDTRREYRLGWWLFIALLGYHLWAVTVGWTSLNLPGGEFRQTQTAISAHFIQQDQDFSLAYPTPVLGKPWSVPMEFPLYQWTVVKLSSWTGWPLTPCGRAVSLACFYLTLPAVFLLLGRVGLPPARRLVVLGLWLTCPVYLLYSRAFLIETMALMFSLWFVAAYLRAVEQRHWGWLLVAVLTGCGGGLVKVTTFLLFLIPAGGWTLWQLWQVRPVRGGRDARDLLRLAGWAAAAAALPCLASIWWVRYADAVKALNPVGAFLTSDNLRGFNFGAGLRFDRAVWGGHFAIWFRELLPAGLLVLVGLLAAIFLRRRWRVVAGLILLFLAVQVAFPLLYAWHEYYYVANAGLLLLAVGLVLDEVLESRLPRVAVWGLVLAVQGWQIGHSLQAHRAEMKQWSFGGSPLTAALKALSEPDDVLVIVGEDWNSMMPYYAQRRALMLPGERLRDTELVARAFQNLKGERVAALVITGQQDDAHRALIGTAERMLGLDWRPVFSWGKSVVHVHRDLRLSAIAVVPTVREGSEIVLTSHSQPDIGALMNHEVELASLPRRLRANFSMMTPQPWKYYTTFGADVVNLAEGSFFTAHPDTRLWFKLAAAAQTISMEYLINPGGYAPELSAADASDGITVSFSRELPDGAVEALATRRLDPRNQVADRGPQTLRYQGELPAGSVVRVEVGPGPKGNYVRDSTYLGKIEIR